MLPNHRPARHFRRSLATISILGIVLLVAETAHANGGGTQVGLWSFIKPTGLITLSLIIIAAGLAGLRKIRPRLMLKLHKIFAALAVVSALCHATLVFLSE